MIKNVILFYYFPSLFFFFFLINLSSSKYLTMTEMFRHAIQNNSKAAEKPNTNRGEIMQSTYGLD